MTWEYRWVVLVPGEVFWVEELTYQWLEEFYGWPEHAFIVIPGEGRYQALVETGAQDRDPGRFLANAFSRMADEPVYAIERSVENPAVACFVKGEETAVRREADELVRSLGCKVPWFEPPPPSGIARVIVTLIQGIPEARLRQALARKYKNRRPEDFVITAGPQGLLMRDDKGWLGMAMVDVSFRFPRATTYTVRSTPDLESFDVTILHKRGDAQFVPAPGKGIRLSHVPAVPNVMGEREPERILAAMGIPKEWFQW